MTKTIAGIALGFALMPATFGMIALFSWAAIHFELSKTDTALGGLLGIGVAIIAGVIALAVGIYTR